jgi:hypothetical protein
MADLQEPDAMTTAAARYESLTTDRSPFIDRAERASELTIPFLMEKRTMEIRQDFQSLGARCVKNLASKLLLALFPPGAAFFKLAVDDFVLETLQGGDNEDPTGEIEAALALKGVATGLRWRWPSSTSLPPVMVF